MKKNVGGIDKILRIVLGLALLLTGLLAPLGANLRILALVLAAVALLTGIFGF